MSARYCYPGRVVTAADNPRLPYSIRVMPTGAAYTEFYTGTRRLATIFGINGLLISTLEDVPVLLRRDGSVLVGDEIERGKKDEPAKVEPEEVEA